MEFPNDALLNYVFPNDVVEWSIMIVIYPYITGLIAGAFVVSALSHVFKIKVLQPIANFALVMSFCFGLFAGVPLLFHLGQPQRAFQIFVTPHLTSAMSVFGYVYASYMVLLVLELWFVYRPYFIKIANETTGLQRKACLILVLGVTDYSPGAAKLDHKIIVFLAGIGIPWACFLHGYVGFFLASATAVSWWATPLLPVIFILSAVVSGMAMLLLVYTFICWRRNKRCDFAVINTLVIYTWGFFILTFALEWLAVVYEKYEGGQNWSMIEPLLNGTLYYTHTVGQTWIGSIIPLFLLGVIVLFEFRNKIKHSVSVIACILLALQVLLMRYNTVIGGQLISKSERGFIEQHWEFLGREGFLVASILLAAPFIAYYIISKFIPVFTDPAESEVKPARK